MSGFELVPTGVKKIDDLETDGLDGVRHSVAYRIAELEEHFHSVERWKGIRIPQSGTVYWCDDSLVPYAATSSAGDYGTSAADTANVFGSGDTTGSFTYESGSVKTIYYYDIHRFLVVDVDHDTEYKLRIIWGDTTSDAAITASHYSEAMVKFDSTNPQLSAGVPVEIWSPRLRAGTKVWIQAKNATDDSVISFYVGIHYYQG